MNNIVITWGNLSLSFIGALLSIIFILAIGLTLFIIINTYLNYRSEVKKNFRTIEFNDNDRLYVQAPFETSDEAYMIKKRFETWSGLSSKNILVTNSKVDSKITIVKSENKLKGDNKCQSNKEMN